jgi:hypothetical protein
MRARPSSQSPRSSRSSASRCRHPSPPLASRARRREAVLAPALALVAPLALGACRAAGPAPDERRTQRQEVSDQAAPEPKATARSARAGGGPSERAKLELSITWPTSRDEVARARLSSDAQGKLDLAPVPALAPTEPALAAASRVVVKDAFYSLSARASGLSLYVSGTRVAYRYAALERELERRGGPRTPDGRLPGPHAVRGTDAFVTQNEGVWSVSFFEHGASYVVELACDDPRDARCADDALVRSLAEGLSHVGGRGPGPAPAVAAPAGAKGAP